MPTQKLTNEIIIAAIEGFESQKHRIDDQIAELRSLLPGGTAEPAATPEAPTRKRKKFSAASRRKMAMAQKARWAKIKGESESPAPATPEAPKAKRKLSKAGKAAIVAALKKRWAAKKAEAAK
jgi:cell division septum initiation protein DivIVA